MKKIITRDVLSKLSTKLYAVVDCTINNVEYPKYARITGSDKPSLRISEDSIYTLLRNNVLSVVPIKAKQVRVIQEFPGVSLDVIKYLPYEEENEGKWNHVFIFLNDYVEYNGIKIHIDILDKHPTFFEITLVENPEVKEIEYI